MARLDLEFNSLTDADGITVDGKFVKLKQEKNKGYACSIETDKNECEVFICKGHKYLGKNWFWWNLLFFVISIFGIFDMRNGKFLVWDVRLKISTNKDTKVVLNRADFTNGGKVVNIESDSEVEEISNIQIYDNEAKVRNAKMKKFKTWATIISLVTIVLIIIL